MIVMEVLSSQGVEYFEEIRKNHFDRLKHEFGIESAEAYLNFSNGMNTADNQDKVRKYLKENDVSLDVFFHPTPLIEQKIMYASLNPAITSVSCSKFDSGSWSDRQKSGGDVEKITWATIPALGNYLYENYSSEEMIKSLMDNVDSLPNTEQKSYKEYVVVDSRDEVQSSYYSDVYHTRFCKLASEDGDFIEKFGKEYLRKQFAKEVKLVEPKLLITGCRDAWRSIQDYFVDDSESEIETHRGSANAKKYSKHADETALPGVFKIPSEDLWVITISQESRPFQDFDEFNKNIEYVNDKIEL